jgi:pullulanase-type alpha-1,6-glucosidase
VDNKKLNMTVVAKTLIPLLSAAVLAGCNSSSDSGTDAGGNTGNIEGLYNPAENEVVIYYKRDVAAQSGASYEGWGLHLWNGDGCNSTDLEAMGISGETAWTDPHPYTGVSDTYGAYYVLKVDPDAADPHECMNFILHKGDEKAFGGNNLKVELRNLQSSESKGLFGFHGSSKLYYAPIEERPVVIDGRAAHWIDSDTIAWEAAGSASKLALYHSSTGGIELDEDKNITGGEKLELSIGGDLSDDQKKRFKHLESLKTATNNFTAEEIHDLLKGQVVIVAYNSNDEIMAATEIQSAGALDAIYASEEAGDAMSEVLGAVVESGSATFKLWAPTAQKVALEIYDEDKKLEQTIDMDENTDNGVWSSDPVSGAEGKFYRYHVTVYHPTTGKVEERLVTDPYSLSVSANSRYSHVVDLSDPALAPANWGGEFESPTKNDIDHVLYESHIRDFSFSDANGTTANNGKYLAFTEAERESVKHLQALKDAGMTTLHVLPAFDIATVDEVNRVDITDTVGDLCEAKSDAAICATGNMGDTIESVLEDYDTSTGDAQALMNDLRMLDSFNWGYDPFHYTVPEGSYASDADGSARIKEFREMVQATHDMGLKFVMDVVYNHTNASGVNDKSVLDKIVPGYYHRLNINTGDVEMSTCCDNTATENLMMGKLMVDSLKVWAEDYNVDGFRFDLMGHQPKALMVEALEAVKAIDEDTIFYGEGWDFGEVAQHARFEQATQIAMAGTGIGTFSDRLRDAVRGGSPFDGGEDQDGRRSLKYNQGFGNAAYMNDEVEDTAATTKAMLHNQDLVRLGMAGNLATYILLDSEGNTTLGKNVDYNGAPAGYTEQPSENISYVSKHDNQTLWDNNAYKIASGTSAAERARMQTVSLSTVMMGQGIPFIHMGSELLRSKSMQRDSYDSGDWYNRVRFDGSDNNWNVGLPREDKDGANWKLIKEIIADSTAKPDADDIELSKQQFMELLTIRNDSELFRLATAAEVKNRVDFRNVGADQTQGLIVMTIDDGTSAGGDIDGKYDAIVVVINSTATTQDFTIEDAAGFVLHDVQKASADDIVKTATFADSTFTVPPLTTAVFVLPQNGAQGAGLPVDLSNKDVSNLPPYGETDVYVRGSLTGDSWPAIDAFKMSFVGNGIYTLTVGLEAGNHEFKFADANWGDVNIPCDWAEQASDSIDLGTEGNCKLSVETAGKYTFTVDASYMQNDTADKPVVSVVAAPDAPTWGDTALYLRGDVTDSGWAAIDSAKFTYVANDVYALEVSLNAGNFNMKVADSNWSDATIFAPEAEGVSVEFGTPLTLSVGSGTQNLGIAIPSAGDYRFEVNFADKSAPVLTVTQL